MKNEVNRALVAKKKFYLLTILCALLGMNQAWAEDVTTEGVYDPSYEVKDGASASESSLTISSSQIVAGDYVFTDANGVKFTLDLSGGDISVDGDKLYLGNGSPGTNKSSYLSWEAPANYDITLTKIVLQTRIYSSKTARCLIGGTATGEIGTQVNNVVGSNTKVEAEDENGFSSNILISHYCANSSGGIGSRQVYIASIKVSYQLTYNSKIFGFDAAASENNNTYGTASVVLKDEKIYAGAGENSASTTATYSAEIADADEYKFLGWFSDAECINFVSLDNPYVSTLNNVSEGSVLKRTLYAKFDVKGVPTVTCNIADNYNVDDEALDLPALWTTESEGKVTYSLLSFEPLIKEEEGATLPALDGDNKVSLGQAGTLHLQMDIEAAGDFGPHTAFKDVNINKIKTTFKWTDAPYYFNTVINIVSSNNDEIELVSESSEPSVASVNKATLTIYNFAGTAIITASQAGNYKWTALEESREVTPTHTAEHLPIASLTSANASTYEVSFSGEAKWELKDAVEGITFGSGSWGMSKPEGYAIFHFTGIPEAVNFTTSCLPVEVAGTHYPSKEDYTFEVFESVDGVDWGTSTWTCDNSKAYLDSDNKDANRSIALDPASRYVKLRYRGSCWGRMTNISVTELKQFEAENVDFGEVVINSEVAEKTLTFKHANAGYNVSVEFEEAGEEKFFTIDHLTVANTGGDKYGEENFKVTFNPSVLGEHTATVTFSDLLGNEKVVTLSANVIKITPTVTAPEAKELTYSGFAQDLVDAATTDGGTLLYRIGEGEWSAAVPQATNAGEYVVWYKVEGNEIYDDVAEASVNVTIAKATPEITTKPQAADIKLGQTLSESVLYGGEANVDGTFAWQDGSIEPDSAVTYQFNVVFTPNDTENYNSVIFEVGVKVTDTGTDVDNTKSEVKATKILRNGQVLILRDGKIYNIQGMEVR